ncbi:MAG: GTPase HflX [Pseudomonadota bacterium]
MKHLFERAQGSDKAVLVHIGIGRTPLREDTEEIVRLAETAGALCVGMVTGKRDKQDAALFAGSGKVAEIKTIKESEDADLIIFNHALSGAQERNLERELSCRVIDRVSLILDIFAQRAQSAEGKLQVELAQLQHISTRLVRGWTHLDRQRGGGIGMRGPGETQLETDRRLLGKRISQLQSRLEKVQKQHHTQRRARLHSGIANVAIVGYTNAGKSSLFNVLTKSGAYAADQLFATLDTTVRKVYVPEARPMVLSDTVGFIRDLPHQLVTAFRATLTEAMQADLLLHVVDAASPERDAQIDAVNLVLREIGADSIPQILLMNKIDCTDYPAQIHRDENQKITTIYVSAQQKLGLELIRQALQEFFPKVAYESPSNETTLSDQYSDQQAV